MNFEQKSKDERLTQDNHYKAESITRANKLIDLTQRLRARLQAETIAYQSQRPQDVHSSLEETRALSALYGLEVSRIKANPNLLDGLTDDLKSRLKTETNAFQKIMAQYELTVQATKIVSEGLMKAIVAEMQKKSIQPSGYSSKGCQSNQGLNSLNYGTRA